MIGEMQRTLRAQKLRDWLIENDPEMQQSIASSKASAERTEQHREANRRAADCLGLEVGDQVTIRSEGHEWDGRSGEIAGFEELMNGRRLAQVVVMAPRRFSSVPMPPARLQFSVDVELLHKA